MNILNLVEQYLVEKGFILGPYNPGCFFYEDDFLNPVSLGRKCRIVLILNNGKTLSFMRTKEPTVVMARRAWNDSVLVDLTEPGSIKKLDEFL